MNLLKLKNSHILKFSLLLFSCLLAIGCLSEGDTFGDDTDLRSLEDLDIGTLAIPAFLDNSQTCFNIEFPIQLISNTNTLISISKLSELEEFTKSQSELFFTSGIVMPFDISFDGNSRTIDTQSKYQDLVSQCSLQTISDFYQNIENKNCISFNFPIELTIDNTSIAIENNTELAQTISNSQSFDINYPLEVFDLNQNIIEVKNDFDFFNILKECSNTTFCFEHTIDLIQQENEYPTFSFFAEIISIEPDTSAEILNEITYTWTVNGEERTDKTTPSADFIFNEDGVYEICVTTLIENCDTITKCTSITVSENTLFCFDYTIDLTQQENQLPTYSFFAEIISNEPDVSTEAFSKLTYAWTVNGEERLDKTNSFSDFVFNEDGIYEVCVTTQVENCDIVTECTSITVSENILICKDLEISLRLLEEGSSLYEFRVPEEFIEKYASFQWQIANEFQENTAHILSFDFSNLEKDVYLICVTGFGDECQENNDMICEEIDLR